MKINEKSVMP